jgi:hypothetical protein
MMTHPCKTFDNAFYLRYVFPYGFYLYLLILDTYIYVTELAIHFTQCKNYILSKI